MKKTNNEVVTKEELTHLLLIILEIARSDIHEESNIEEVYRKRLKFQETNSWKKYRATIDLIDDTEYAIMSAFQFQLGDIRKKKKDIGETYIRLYGVLNAVYLQMKAYEIIANLLNFPERNQVRETFHKLKIYQLRNIAASHTADYDYKTQINSGINKKTSFRIMQSELEETGRNITALDENDNFLKFNLKELLTEYESVARNLLIQLINHLIKELVYKKEDKVELRKRLNEMLPRLIDYSIIDENEKYMTNLKKRIKKRAAANTR